MIITQPIIRGGGREIIIGSYLVQSVAGTTEAKRIASEKRSYFGRKRERKVEAVGDADKGRVIDLRV